MVASHEKIRFLVNGHRLRNLLDPSLRIFFFELTSFFIMSCRCRSPKKKEEEEQKKQKDIPIKNHYYNPIESDQITEVMSDYYMFLTLKNRCQNHNYSLVLDTKNWKVNLNLERTVPDRVEYEELKIDAQKYEEEQRKMTGKFPYVLKDPRIWMDLSRCSWRIQTTKRSSKWRRVKRWHSKRSWLETIKSDIYWEHI